MRARLTVLSGPSGVGKGTVRARLAQLVPDLWVSVSATTRLPRGGEREGVDYLFVDRQRFADMLAGGELLEHAEFAGNLYGTPRQPVLDRLDAGHPVLLEIELQGARQVRDTMPAAQFVFLAPPSVDELVSRLHTRNTETGEQLDARMAAAAVELAAAAEFDHVVVNDDIDRAAREVAALVESGD